MLLRMSRKERRASSDWCTHSIGDEDKTHSTRLNPHESKFCRCTLSRLTLTWRHLSPVAGCAEVDPQSICFGRPYTLLILADARTLDVVWRPVELGCNYANDFA